MKKITAFLLTFCMIGVFVSCGQNDTSGTTGTESIIVESLAETSESAKELQESNAVESAQTVETATVENQISETKETAPEENSQTSDKDTANSGNNVLVAYFSATHTTQGVAEKIADVFNADLYEIVPEQPYTDADLNYNDNNSRSTLEMADASVRPAISGSVENMDQYDVVFIGYPIWWGEAPRILSTFVESYDFSGKTIIPFCTSGGSGIGSSASNLEQLTSGATWLNGQRLKGSDSEDVIMEWVNGLGLDLNH